MVNIDGLSMMLQDADKIESEPFFDGSYMLYIYLWLNEAPISVGISAYDWQRLQAKYPQYAAKVVPLPTTR